MPIKLSQMTEKLHKDCLALDAKKTEKLVNVLNVGNDYVEIMSKYVERYAPQNKDILLTVTDEFFVDIHASVTLAAGGFYRARACS